MWCPILKAGLLASDNSTLSCRLREGMVLCSKDCEWYENGCPAHRGPKWPVQGECGTIDSKKKGRRNGNQ